MRRLPHILVFALILLGFGSWGNTFATADGGALSLDELREMRRDRASIRQMMEAIQQRGLAFEVDDDMARQLRGLGFSGKHIIELKKRQSENATIVAPVEAAQGGGQPAPIGRALDAQTEARYQIMGGMVDRIAAECGVALKVERTPHTTLVASERIGATVLPDVSRLEKLVAARFPEPFASGVDARANTIALLETRYDYENWMKALFKVLQDNGTRFDGQDPLASAMKTNALFVNGIFSICLEGMDQESIRRSVAFGMGYQYFGQLANFQSPAALQGGFGNITETMMFPDPQMTVQGNYTDRQIGRVPTPWAALVRQRFAQNQIGSVANVMAYSVETMEVPQYADAWSLTSLLASEPQNFAELVTKLGTGVGGLEAITQVYGTDDAQTMQHWRKAVLGR